MNKKGKKGKDTKNRKKVGKWRSDGTRGDCPGPTRGSYTNRNFVLGRVRPLNGGHALLSDSSIRAIPVSS